MSMYPSGPMGLQQERGFGVTENEATLSRFFNAVYAWMAVGLAVTAVVAYVAFSYSGQYPILISRGLVWPLFIVEIGLVMVVSGAINRINATTATGLFLLYAALNGVTLSMLFAIYTRASLATVFFETAAAFGVMSVYGAVTKRDLSRLGSLLFMALVGIVIASLVNFFLHSSMLYWIVSYFGVVVFIGLTAYDTQRLKMIGLQTANNPAMAHRMAVVGSLTLYLDFLNLFLFLLQAMGDRRR